MQFLARIKRLHEGRLGKDGAITAGHEDGRTGPLHSGRLRAIRMTQARQQSSDPPRGVVIKKSRNLKIGSGPFGNQHTQGFGQRESPPRSKKSSLAPIRSMSKASANRPTINVSRSPFGASKGVASAKLSRVSKKRPRAQCQKRGKSVGRLPAQRRCVPRPPIVVDRAAIKPPALAWGKLDQPLLECFMQPCCNSATSRKV